MKTKKRERISLAVALITSLAIASTSVSAPPTPVSEMTKQEEKAYKRDAKDAAFGTKENKDKSSGLTWLESPVNNSPATPNLYHYFRAAFKEEKLVVLQIIIMHTQANATEYNRSTNDYTSSKLNGMLLPTEAGEPMRNSAEDTTTARSAISITEKTLRDHELTGMELYVTNSYGDQEVPIKPALITGYLRRLDQLKKKLSK